MADDAEGCRLSQAPQRLENQVIIQPQRRPRTSSRQQVMTLLRVDKDLRLIALSKRPTWASPLCRQNDQIVCTSRG